MSRDQGMVLMDEPVEAAVNLPASVLRETEERIAAAAIPDEGGPAARPARAADPRRAAEPRATAGFD